jgi:GAF domain-containing protein
VDTVQHNDNAPALDDALGALRSLSAANEKLVWTIREPEFLQAACKIVVDKGGYVMAWVGFAEHAQGKAVRPAAQYGCEAGYLASANITWADTERGQGPTGCAIRTGRTQVNQNILTNPVMAPWRNEALKRGYQSSIGLPLKGDLGTFGALAIYAREPEAFGKNEVGLLIKFAAELSSVIVTLHTKATSDGQSA